MGQGGERAERGKNCGRRRSVKKESVFKVKEKRKNNEKREKKEKRGEL